MFQPDEINREYHATYIGQKSNSLEGNAGIQKTKIGRRSDDLALQLRNYFTLSFAHLVASLPCGSTESVPISISLTSASVNATA